MRPVMAASAAAAAGPALVAVAGVVLAARLLSVVAVVVAARLTAPVVVAAAGPVGRLLVPEEPAVAPVAEAIALVGL